MRAKYDRNDAVIKAYEETGSPKQVAEMFGITPGRVNQIIDRALTEDDPMADWTGDDLQSVRKALDLSSERFAHLVGIGYGATIRAWEERDYIPTQTAIIAFLLQNSPEARRLLIKKRIGD